MLPIRVALYEHFELGDELRVPAELEIGLDPRLGRREDPLLDPPDLRRRPRLERDIGERPSPHERQRLAQLPGAPSRGGSGRTRDKRVEHVHVDLVGSDDYFVATSAGEDALLAERLSQPGDVDLNALLNRR